MTKLTIKELRGLCEKATPGPWEERIIFEKSHGDPTYASAAAPWQYSDGWDSYYGDIAKDETKANAAFIAASRTAIPMLLDEIEELREALKRIVGVNRSINTHYHDIAAEALAASLERLP